MASILKSAAARIDEAVPLATCERPSAKRVYQPGMYGDTVNSLG